MVTNNKKIDATTKLFLTKAFFFLLLWIIFSCYLLWENKNLASTRQSILFMRSYSFMLLYMVMIFPLCFFEYITNRKMYLFCMGYSFLLALVTSIFLLLFSFDIPGHLSSKYAPSYILFNIMYDSIFIVVITIGYTCKKKYSILVSVIIFLVTTSIFWANSLLHLSWMRMSLLYSNPLIAISRCFENYDILRTGDIYELCTMGANYPFEYPAYIEYIFLYIFIAVCIIVTANRNKFL